MPASCTNGGTHEVRVDEEARERVHQRARAPPRSRSASRSSRRSSRARRAGSCARASPAATRSLANSSLVVDLRVDLVGEHPRARRARSARRRAATSCGASIPPVGFCGELRITSLVRSPSSASSASGSNAKSRSSQQRQRDRPSRRTSGSPTRRSGTPGRGRSTSSPGLQVASTVKNRNGLAPVGDEHAARGDLDAARGRQVLGDRLAEAPAAPPPGSSASRRRAARRSPPASRARGVAKSGSPISRWITSRPAASSAFARARTLNADSVPSSCRLSASVVTARAYPPFAAAGARGHPSHVPVPRLRLPAHPRRAGSLRARGARQAAGAGSAGNQAGVGAGRQARVRHRRTARAATSGSRCVRPN